MFRSSSGITAPASRKSSIFLQRMIGSMFMRVNSKCVHQLRPPPGPNVKEADRWV
jgi:hypothetical protein